MVNEKQHSCCACARDGEVVSQEATRYHGVSHEARLRLGGYQVNELEVLLSMSAIRSMLEGDAIVFTIEDKELKIILRCNEESFREYINKSMLAFLPTPPEVH